MFDSTWPRNRVRCYPRLTNKSGTFEGSDFFDGRTSKRPDRGRRHRRAVAGDRAQPRRRQGGRGRNQKQWAIHGVGIIQPGNAIRAYKALGIADRCIERGFVYKRQLHFDADGNLIGERTMPAIEGLDIDWPLRYSASGPAGHSGV